MTNAPGRKLTAMAFSLFVVAACSSEPGRLSLPTSPSSTTLLPQQPAASGDATVTGRVNPTAGVARSSVGPTSGISVTVVGTGLSTQTNTEGRFELQGVPAGDVRLEFKTQGLEAELEINNVQHRERIEIEVIAVGSSASVTSSSRSGADGVAELKGAVSGLSGSCPSLTFMVSGTSVMTTSSTQFKNGTCDSVASGAQVEVKGTLQSGAVVAQSVDIQGPADVQPPQPPQPPQPLLEQELNGAVSNLAGTCPDVTFSVNGTGVATSSSTLFRNGSCGSIANGALVEAKGPIQGGTMMAQSVEIELPVQVQPPQPQPQLEQELNGAVSNLAGTCPNLTFSVNGTGVATSSSTLFRNGSCGSVANGALVEAKGPIQGGTMMAQSVEIELPVQVQPPQPQPQLEQELNGAVSNLTGTCPNLTFSVNGTTVTTSSSTLFREAPCSAMANGVQVEAKGPIQGGTMIAQDIEVRAAEVEVEPELNGAVSDLAGTCPNLMFRVNGTLVTTSSSTLFREAPCSAMANGVQVEAKGPIQGGTMIAQDIEVRAAEVEVEVEVKGTVSNLGGSCPSVTFTVNGRDVTTSASTQFKDGSCSAVANGTRVEVKGTLQGGTLIASRVAIKKN